MENSLCKEIWTCRKAENLTELVSSLFGGKRWEVLLASPLSVLHLGRYQLCEKLDRILQVKVKTEHH